MKYASRVLFVFLAVVSVAILILQAENKVTKDKKKNKNDSSYVYRSLDDSLKNNRSLIIGRGKAPVFNL
ncbi:MAG: hypothetical protein AB8E15_11995 [Bdellovibrionales bacterium]